MIFDRSMSLLKKILFGIWLFMLECGVILYKWVGYMIAKSQNLVLSFEVNNNVSCAIDNSLVEPFSKTADLRIVRCWNYFVYTFIVTEIKYTFILIFFTIVWFESFDDFIILLFNKYEELYYYFNCLWLFFK